MVHEQGRDKFRSLLRHEREPLFNYRSDWEGSLKRLQEPEPELEERAQKELISRDLESLDEQGIAVIEAIDRALRKLETGSYGVCDGCGEMIPDGRLEAIPWTPWCAECAEREEKGSGFPPREGEEASGQDVGMDVQGMRDEALKTMIEGSFPSETKHQMLLQFLTDTLGIRDVADRVSIDRQLWEKHDRSPDQGEESGKSEAELIMQGEEEKEETYEAMAEGTSTLPSDRFIPEKED